MAALTPPVIAGSARRDGHDLRLAGALALAPMAVTGIARFAYGLLVPAMRADLGWSFTQAGAMNTANALGYLVGTLLSLRMADRVDARRSFRVGLWLSAAALIATALMPTFELLLALRTLVGIGSALAFVSGAALVTRIGSRERAPLAIAVYFSGAGAGIVVSGAMVPWLLATQGDAAWRHAWLGLGALCVLGAAPSIWAAGRLHSARAAQRAAAPWRMRTIAPSLTAHALFGAGYIAYMTFVVSWMAARGSSPCAVATVWVALGVAVIASPLLWRRPLRDGRGPWPLAASIGVLAIGAALPLIGPATPVMVVSAALVGSAIMLPAASSGAFVRRCVSAPAIDTTLATYSVVFSIGQCLGPIVSGAIADASGALHAALITSLLLLTAAAAAACLQRELAPHA
jgi:predicted MFS family arabinose efflux permease